METSSVPYFLLEWLKENTGHYQYLTAEAQDLKASIESMMPQSDELNIKECELYWKFLAMLEENPFTAYNQEGIPAQIMADDFYYYFYPVSDQDELWYPMELYVKLGSVSTTEKARQMYERMLESIGWWKEDFIQNTEKRRNKKAKELLSGSAQVEDIHGHLLDKGWFSFIILELLLLGMSGLGVFRFVCAYFVNGRKDLLDIKSLKGLSFGIAGMVCMTLLVKALIFWFRTVNVKGFCWHGKTERQNRKMTQKK